MKSCLVSFDLKHPSSAYSPLHERPRSLNFQQLQGPLWGTPEALEPEDVKVALLPHVKKEDGIFVFQLDPATVDFATHTSRSGLR